MNYHKLLRKSRYTSVEVDVNGITGDIRRQLLREYGSLVSRDRMKLFLLIVFLVGAVVCNAGASSYDPKTQALYSPGLIDAIIHEQIDKHPHTIDLTIRENIDQPGSVHAVSCHGSCMPLPTSKEDMKKYVYR